MSSTSPNSKPRPGGNFGLFLEWGIVLGLCALALSVIIPAGTSDSANFGLSPRMVPIVTVFVIIVFVFVGLVSDLRKKTAYTTVTTEGVSAVLLLIVAATAGVVFIHYFGLVWGGAILLLLCSFALGERRLRQLLLMGITALGLLLLVDWSGF